MKLFGFKILVSSKIESIVYFSVHVEGVCVRKCLLLADLSLCDNRNQAIYSSPVHRDNSPHPYNTFGVSLRLLKCFEVRHLNKFDVTQ